MKQTPTKQSCEETSSLLRNREIPHDWALVLSFIIGIFSSSLEYQISFGINLAMELVRKVPKEL